jgi:GNAT superfamily N-acetyltransferase
MFPIPRSIEGEDDYWRIRSFLREVFVLNGRQELSWHVARLDYWRWHFIENCQICPPFEQVTTLWETARGQIAAVLHPMGFGEAWLHLHPGYRTPELEAEMITLAEERLSRTLEDGGRRLAILADRNDILRQRILQERGYARRDRPVHRWWRDLDAPLPGPSVAPGYTIRAMGDRDEYPARSWASWRAFHPDEPDDEYEGWAWYGNIQSAPLYRRDLDIVAATAGGEIAAFGTIWFDDVTRSGVCVLVGTVPEHQRRGLARAVVTEGLRRLRSMGATRAFANGHDPPADALYGSVLGTKAVSEVWIREF